MFKSLFSGSSKPGPVPTTRRITLPARKQPLYDTEAVKVWNDTATGAAQSVHGRSWDELERANQARLNTLGYDKATWEGAQRGRLLELPLPAKRRFKELTGAQQTACKELGWDSNTWDRQVATRDDILGHFPLLQAFEKLRKAHGDEPLDAHQVSEYLIPATHIFGGTFRTRGGQRALAYLRAVHADAFTSDAHRVLADEINERLPTAFCNHGWVTSVLPVRTDTERKRVEAGGAAVVNDASGMEATVVADLVAPRTQEEVRDTLLRARHHGWTVRVAGARHSQGGQSCEGGMINIDMSQMRSVTVQDDNTVWAEAGATWEDVIETLNKAGGERTVQIMQASSIFSVGGSIAVNAHGRTSNDGPLSTSVKAMEVMLADGSVQVVRPEDKLFKHVLGGYGMYGVVLRAQLNTVPNSTLKMHTEVLPQEDFPSKFAAAIVDGRNKMAWGRIDPTFHGDTMLHVATEVEDAEAQKAAQKEAQTPAQRGRLARLMPEVLDFERMNLTRAEQLALTASKYGTAVKGTSSTLMQLRWGLEKRMRAGDSWGKLSDMLNLNAWGLKAIGPLEARRTDLLEELFVPFFPEAEGEDAKARDARFNSFLDALRNVQAKYKRHSLNITVRFVRGDKDSALPYARQDSVAFVLYYQQGINGDERRVREALQRDLIDAVQAHGGSFYFPYARGFTEEQVKKSYPGREDALKYKDEVDPHGVFWRYEQRV